MHTSAEIKLLKDTADVGLGYASQLIEWFGTAERAIEYLCASDAERLSNPRFFIPPRN